MAWDAFRAQEFPADEARKLALALGLDLEKDLVRDKRLVTKKSASVVLNLPADRRKKGMVDEDAETLPAPDRRPAHGHDDLRRGRLEGLPGLRRSPGPAHGQPHQGPGPGHDGGHPHDPRQSRASSSGPR